MEVPAIARALGMTRSTVGLILRRQGLAKLSALDPKIPVVRYDRIARLTCHWFVIQRRLEPRRVLRGIARS